MKNLLIVWLILFWSVNISAKLRTEVVDYKHGNTELEGYLAYDDDVKGKRPGVLVVHEWWGHNKYVRKRAEQIARLGYIAFALDMYGKGKIAKDFKEAGSLAGIYRSDRALMRARANAGLDVLKKHNLTDTDKIAAIGYCFGGTTVLELARGGALLSGVVSFHGSLDAPNYDKKEIKAKVLVLHGGDDKSVKPEHMSGFQDEMRKSNADWQVYIYGGAVHSFTNPDSGNDPSKGVAYNEKADKRSWEAMKLFFAEIFK
ncbi:dienelactone hydrolase family protein [Candidatus Desantisbacteria bacterium]|nr:dienelactone hydrolase family protein [Candidatus Desantisbacteria bacterium]